MFGGNAHHKHCTGSRKAAPQEKSTRSVLQTLLERNSTTRVAPEGVPTSSPVSVLVNPFEADAGLIAGTSVRNYEARATVSTSRRPRPSPIRPVSKCPSSRNRARRSLDGLLTSGTRSRLNGFRRTGLGHSRAYLDL